MTSLPPCWMACPPALHHLPTIACKSHKVPKGPRSGSKSVVESERRLVASCRRSTLANSFYWVLASSIGCLIKVDQSAALQDSENVLTPIAIVYSLLGNMCCVLAFRHLKQLLGNSRPKALHCRAAPQCQINLMAHCYNMSTLDFLGLSLTAVLPISDIYKRQSWSSESWAAKRNFSPLYRSFVRCTCTETIHFEESK